MYRWHGPPLLAAWFPNPDCVIQAVQIMRVLGVQMAKLTNSRGGCSVIRGQHRR